MFFVCMFVHFWKMTGMPRFGQVNKTSRVLRLFQTTQQCAPKIVKISIHSLEQVVGIEEFNTNWQFIRSQIVEQKNRKVSSQKFLKSSPNQILSVCHFWDLLEQRNSSSNWKLETNQNTEGKRNCRLSSVCFLVNAEQLPLR